MNSIDRSNTIILLEETENINKYYLEINKDFENIILSIFLNVDEKTITYKYNNLNRDFLKIPNFIVSLNEDILEDTIIKSKNILEYIDYLERIRSEIYYDVGETYITSVALYKLTKDVSKEDVIFYQKAKAFLKKNNIIDHEVFSLYINIFRKLFNKEMSIKFYFQIYLSYLNFENMGLSYASFYEVVINETLFKKYNIDFIEENINMLFGIFNILFSCEEFEENYTLGEYLKNKNIVIKKKDYNLSSIETISKNYIFNILKNILTFKEKSLLLEYTSKELKEIRTPGSNSCFHKLMFHFDVDFDLLIKFNYYIKNIENWTANSEDNFLSNDEEEFYEILLNKKAMSFPKGFLISKARNEIKAVAKHTFSYIENTCRKDLGSRIYKKIFDELNFELINYNKLFQSILYYQKNDFTDLSISLAADLYSN